MDKLKELLKETKFIKDKYNIKGEADAVLDAIRKYIIDDKIYILPPSEFIKLPLLDDWMDEHKSFTISRHAKSINNKTYLEIEFLNYYIDKIFCWCIPLRKRNKDFIKCFFLPFRIKNIIDDLAKKYKKDCKRKKIVIE